MSLCLSACQTIHHIVTTRPIPITQHVVPFYPYSHCRSVHYYQRYQWHSIHGGYLLVHHWGGDCQWTQSIDTDLCAHSRRTHSIHSNGVDWRNYEEEWRNKKRKWQWEMGMVKEDIQQWVSMTLPHAVDRTNLRVVFVLNVPTYPKLVGRKRTPPNAIYHWT